MWLVSFGGMILFEIHVKTLNALPETWEVNRRAKNPWRLPAFVVV